MIAVGLVGMSAVVFARAAGAQSRDLFDAVRRDDTGAVRALLKAGADLNARDDTGATPLMHAAAVASPDTMRALLADGAASATAWAVIALANVP